MKNRANQILELLTEAKKNRSIFLSGKAGGISGYGTKGFGCVGAPGVVLREHGFALLRNTNDISGRLAYHYEAKLKIARRAAELIADGDTLMIENGSCCALLAVELAAQKKELTIITNSAFIANYIRGKADASSRPAGRYLPAGFPGFSGANDPPGS